MFESILADVGYNIHVLCFNYKGKHSKPCLSQHTLLVHLSQGLWFYFVHPDLFTPSYFFSLVDGNNCEDVMVCFALHWEIIWVPIHLPRSFWLGLRPGERLPGANGQDKLTWAGGSPAGNCSLHSGPRPLFNGAVLYTSQWTESKADVDLFQAIAPIVFINSWVLIFFNEDFFIYLFFFNGALLSCFLEFQALVSSKSRNIHKVY